MRQGVNCPALFKLEDNSTLFSGIISPSVNKSSCQRQVVASLSLRETIDISLADIAPKYAPRPLTIQQCNATQARRETARNPANAILMQPGKYETIARGAVGHRGPPYVTWKCVPNRQVRLSLTALLEHSTPSMVFVVAIDE
jgi:hypothetical protein